MVKIIRVDYEIVELFLGKQHIGTIHNDLELMEVAIQIATDGLTGYSLKWNNIEIPINDKGELANWPKGMYSGAQERFAILHKIRKERLKSKEYFEGVSEYENTSLKDNPYSEENEHTKWNDWWKGYIIMINLIRNPFFIGAIIGLMVFAMMWIFIFIIDN